MPKNQFGSFSDEVDTGFEQSTPVRSTAQAAKNAATQVVKGAAKQASDTTKAFVDMLYGASSTTGDEQSPDGGATPPPAQKQHTAQGQTATSQQTPEQAKMDETRKQLHQLHNQNYGNQFTMESELQQQRQQRKQAEQQRAQEEEDDKQRSMEAEQSNMQDLEQPQGKQTGMQGARKKKSSIVLSRAKTKAETNRGASG